jgi:hypothetical protein
MKRVSPKMVSIFRDADDVATRLRSEKSLRLPSTVPAILHQYLVVDNNIDRKTRIHNEAALRSFAESRGNTKHDAVGRLVEAFPRRRFSPSGTVPSRIQYIPWLPASLVSIILNFANLSLG